jgi:hypothetical protein
LVVVALVGAWFLLFGVAWAMSDPVPAGPDEAMHMVHALAVGQGEITGQPGPSPNRPLGLNDTIRFWDQTTRYFSVNARRAPDSVYSCVARSLDQPANCTDGPKCQRYVPPSPTPCSDPAASAPGNRFLGTYTGTYEPTLYALPGLAARLATNDVGAMRLARLGAVIFGTAFVMVAAALVWDRRARGLSLLGLIVALTPMVLYMNGVLNPDGGEMVLTACFFAAVLRVLRGNDRASRSTWTALGVSGGLLAVSRPITWLWIAVAVAIAVALGAGRALAVLRRAGPRAWVAMAAVVLGLVADQVWWRGIVQTPQSSATLSTYLANIGGSIAALPGWFHEEIGLLGWVELPVPLAVAVAWWCLIVGLLLTALVVGTWRQRVVLALAIMGDLVVTVLLGAVLQAQAGLPMQARYMLPFNIIVVMLAGEIVLQARHRQRRWVSSAVVVAAVAAVLCNGASWWANSQRFAVGIHGPVLFPSHPSWSPPLGWATWVVVVAIGALALIGAVVVAELPRRLGRANRQALH